MRCQIGDPQFLLLPSFFFPLHCQRNKKSLWRQWSLSKFSGSLTQLTQGSIVTSVKRENFRKKYPLSTFYLFINSFFYFFLSPLPPPLIPTLFSKFFEFPSGASISIPERHFYTIDLFYSRFPLPTPFLSFQVSKFVL